MCPSDLQMWTLLRMWSLKPNNFIFSFFKKKSWTCYFKRKKMKSNSLKEVRLRYSRGLGRHHMRALVSQERTDTKFPPSASHELTRAFCLDYIRSYSIDSPLAGLPKLFTFSEIFQHNQLNGDNNQCCWPDEWKHFLHIVYKASDMYI